MRRWQNDVAHQGSSITPGMVCQLVCNAFLTSTKPETICNGFRKTGIWPFNRDLFAGRDFAPSEITNRPDPYKQSELQPEVVIDLSNVDDHEEQFQELSKTMSTLSVERESSSIQIARRSPESSID